MAYIVQPKLLARIYFCLPDDVHALKRMKLVLPFPFPPFFFGLYFLYSYSDRYGLTIATGWQRGKCKGNTLTLNYRV